MTKRDQRRLSRLRMLEQIVETGEPILITAPRSVKLSILDDHLGDPVQRRPRDHGGDDANDHQ